MDKVLSIEERLQANRRQRELKAGSHKIEAVRKLVQCTSCRMRCAMCGCQVDDDDPRPSRFGELNFQLCASCRADFDDYKAMADGREVPELFWRNEQWADLWASWLEYQRAIKDFINSDGFKELMKSLSR